MSPLADLLAFVPLDEADAARLRTFHDQIIAELPEIAARCIEHLQRMPDTATSLSTPELVARMNERIVAWLQLGLVGPHDHAFYLRRMQVGTRHIADDWPQHRMVTFIHVVRMEYQRRALALHPPVEVQDLLASIHRLLDLELAFLARHYQITHHELTSERAREIRDERLTSLQTLTAGLAHEIRNPLNAAKLQLELVGRRLRREDPDDQLLTPVKLAQSELARLTALLRDFLTFAQPVRLNPQTHDVVALVNAVCDQQREAAEARGASIHFHPDAPSLVARVDGPKLTQISEHLLRNAIEVIEAGGVVTVELSATDSSIDLMVTDTGPGIPEPVQTRIYEPFFSTKEGGTGLGMSIVHSLVTLHGGSIRLDTGPRGTRFGVTLPRS